MMAILTRGPRQWALKAQIAFCFVYLSLFGIQAAVRFDVFLGFDGLVPEAGWFPVTFEVANDGPGFTSVVELAPGGFSQGQERRMTVELPTGTTKRFVIPTFAGHRSAMQWNARLLDEQGKVRAEALNIPVRKQNAARVPLVASITRTPVAFPDIKSRQQELRPVVARLQPALFPDHPLALGGLDVLYLSSARALELKLPQVTALIAWLHAGGRLIVGVEQIQHINSTDWLRGIMPVEFNEMLLREEHDEIMVWLRSQQRYDGRNLVLRDANIREFANPYANLGSDPKFNRAALQIATGRLRDGRVLIGPEAAPLAITAHRGRGELIVLTFAPELEPFLSWDNRGYFWAKLADLPPALLAMDQYYAYGGQSSDGIFGAMIDTKQIRKLPVGWLLLLLVGYLAVIGPFDQWWLKKINRQMLTWITFPTYVAFFSVLIYFIGYKLRAGETEYNELQIVDVIPGFQRADLIGRSYASIYSPANARYPLASASPFAVLRGEYLGYYGQDSARAWIEHRGHNYIAEVSVPVWTSQLFVSEWWRQAPTPLEFTITPQAGQWTVAVNNALDIKLTNLRLAVQGRVFELGEVGPRAGGTFTVQRAGGTDLGKFAGDQTHLFQQAATRRQRAFGGRDAWQIADVPYAAMAACFLSRAANTQTYNRFTSPAGLDLTPLVERGHAVLLAWAPGFALEKPMNQFSPRRSERNTLLRVSVPVDAR
jgi:hypothetical protein